MNYTSMLTIPKHILFYLLQPVRFIQTYNRNNFQPDLVAGLTVAVTLLPQAIAFTLIAKLPPEMGLYTAIIGGTVAALWGCSYQMQTGPTNTISPLVLSVLLTVASPGTPEFVIAAGMLAFMTGVFQLAMGLARLGILVNFVSHSVIVGFSTGTGVLIVAGQLHHLFKLDLPSDTLTDTIYGLLTHWQETHLITMILGLSTMILIVALRKLNRKLPAELICMVIASATVFFLGLDKQGVKVIGQLPSHLPPLTYLPLTNLNLIAQLSNGALAIGSIGLISAISISRSLAVQTGQRLESNQEFVAQGLANMACGLFSGYACTGSFTRSAVSYKAGARTPMSAIFSSFFVLVAMFVLAPLAAYLPQVALAGVLIVIAYNMIDRAEIGRIWQGTRGDAVIMLITFLATLFLKIEFAVLMGILFSFAVYIMRTSMPHVYPVLPDESFTHFTYQPDKKSCPQLGVIDILGDLYFGAVNHVEEAILQHLDEHPTQRFLLLRFHSVNQCDFSGIHMLESVVRTYRERGGDVFFVRVRHRVFSLMKSTGFYDHLGADHFLPGDSAIQYLFYKILDPAICIYENDERVFHECQNLPRITYPIEIPVYTDIPHGTVPNISPKKLWEQMYNNLVSPLVVDVREPREFKHGHIPGAQLIPLPKLLATLPNFSDGRQVVLVCRGGRRSTRAAYLLRDKGYDNVLNLEGGMIAWETAGLLIAVE